MVKDWYFLQKFILFSKRSMTFYLLNLQKICYKMLAKKLKIVLDLFLNALHDWMKNKSIIVHLLNFTHLTKHFKLSYNEQLIYQPYFEFCFEK